MAGVHVARGAPVVETAAEKALFTKVNWHILPMLLVAYVFAYIDRVNVGFAQLQMKSELHLSDAVFALGAGLFFVGYFLFEIPSNMALEKIGARKTLLRIMVCWGLCATAMAYVTSPWQFYVLRFLLGAFEAGFFPGCILYFTFWYPSARRGRVISIFMTATVIAGILVGPFNGAVMKFGHGFLGHQGWQWMFIANGLPCLVIGVLAFLKLSDGPDQAKWLTPEEKKLLIDRLESERVPALPGHGALTTLLRDPRVYVLAAIAFLNLAAAYALVFWAPSMIQGWGVKDVFHVGLLKAVPSIVGAIGMLLLGRSSDRWSDRRWHFVLAAGIASVSLLGIAMFAGDLVPSLICYSLATIGIASLTPLLYAFVSESLSKATAAAGIALISSVSSLGPAVSPSINTWILTATGDQKYSLFFIVSLYAAAGLVMAVAVRPRTAPAAVPQPA